MDLGAERTCIKLWRVPPWAYYMPYLHQACEWSFPTLWQIFLFCCKVFGKEKYLDAALKCGEVVWTHGLLKKGYGICHGVAGNAYTFLCLFKQTGDQKCLHRAIKVGSSDLGIFITTSYKTVTHHLLVFLQSYVLG